MIFFTTSWSIFFETAPFLVLGLLLVGWLTVLIPRERIYRYLGEGNLRSAFFASLFGLPLPLCSCSVIPVALGLKDKGASREANLSFLISTPETSVDTVILSWGILGPFFGWFRPAVAFFTAMVSAVFSLAEKTDKPEEEEVGNAGVSSPVVEERQLLEGVGFSVVGRSFVSFLRRGVWWIRKKIRKEEPISFPNSGPSFGALSLTATRYGFITILDSLSFWFILGILIAGLLSSLVPDGWFNALPGGNIAAMFFMALVGIPMYVCALESTPIAAVLIAKGLSPGAALVFLLVGPATNFSSLVMLLKSFGKRFVSIYLSAIVVVSLGAGILVDYLVERFDIPVAYQFLSGGMSWFWTAFSWGASILLLVLLVLSLRRQNWKYTLGGFRRFGIRVLTGFRVLRRDSSGKLRLYPGRAVLRLLAIALVIFFLTGFYTIPPGSEGFETTFGNLTRVRLDPGLHYHFPPPWQNHLIYPVQEVRAIQLGYTLDPELFKRWKEKTLTRSSLGWHSFFTTIQTDTEEYNYLLGDENQVEAKFSVHFTVKDPLKYYFGHLDGDAIVGKALEASLRHYFSVEHIDRVITEGRGDIEVSVLQDAQELLDSYEVGVKLLHLYVVDLHPPVEAVSAFRDVAGAMEDKQTRIHEAYTARAGALPNARGEVERLLQDAQAFAVTAGNESRGTAERFLLLEEVYRRYSKAAGLILYLQSVERTLGGKELYLLPEELLRKSNIRMWTEGSLESLFTGGE
ncbi:MAG: SO_0444 family Cu/Zn efflux transporter [Spirochaetales bacterium]|nr:SO_0444 family Cu/Zn efflux transporter [Spirochaetales bacterium]